MSTGIFVFGSNLGGRHGSGAALTARLRYGAVYGQGVGRTGNAYAIPTKDRQLRVLKLEVIREHVDEFLHYTRAYSQLEFNVTQVGCGLAGFSKEQIAPMFADAGPNVFLPSEWIGLLPSRRSRAWLIVGWRG